MLLGFLSRITKKIKIGKVLLLSAVSILLVVFFTFLFKRYTERFGAFGCFDECFNYVSGYFLLKGKILYKEIYFNHQLIPAYLSAAIQLFFHPSSIYHLVLYHRMFVFFFGLVMDIFLMWRFGFPAVLFVLFFETTKFYFMGSLFLAESLIVYPLVYLFGIVWRKLLDKKLLVFDYIVSAFFAWFAVFTREPLTLATMLMYLLIVFYKKKVAWESFISLIIFALLSFFTLIFTSLPDYIFQVITVNAKTFLPSQVGSYGNPLSALSKIFFYPVWPLIEHKNTLIGEILLSLAIIFLISFAVFIYRNPKKYMAIIIVLVLGVANLRFVAPGTMFYEAFHMLPWYGLFIFITFLLLQESRLFLSKKLYYFFVFCTILISMYPILSVKSFIHEKGDKTHSEFHLNFDRYYIFGEAIKSLARKGDTLYLEQWDELIYWQANLVSSYPYSRYGTRSFSLFQEARDKMFKGNPPDFYYSPCKKGANFFDAIPASRINEYIELNYISEPSCLYMKKSKLKEISSSVWEKLAVLRFSLPGNFVN